jgi:hypothetical protein
MANAEWLEIIKKVQTGELSVEEAARRMEPQPASAGQAEPAGSPAPARPAAEEMPLPDIGWWQYAWLIPLGVGITIFVLSAWLLSWGYMNERFFWFYCSWLPLLLGLFVLLLGVWSRQARWAHVRIRSSDGARVSVSTPIPGRFAGWVLRFLVPRIPALQEKHLDTLPVLLDALGRSRDPIFVDVDDQNGDQVRVFIL